MGVTISSLDEWLPNRTFYGKLNAADRAFTSGPILYELFKEIKSSLEEKQGKEAFLATRYLDFTLDDWKGAASLAP